MNWRKVKLGDILTESKIVSENPNPDKRITVRLKVLGVEKRGFENEVEGATKQYIRKAGQFIYGKQNFHKGAFGIVPKELDGFESSSDLPAFDVDKSCLVEFLFYFFKQGNYYLELAKIASGVATQRINTAQLFELEISLPDIDNQKQIISDIILLENNGTAISTELTHQLTLVKKLRQQLLQDAVQGKLVSQNPNDESASELLKKIKAEKAQLIADKKLKKEKPLPPIKPEEIPFEIPEGWVWCRLGEICTKVTDGFHNTPKKLNEGKIYISATHIREDGIKWIDCLYISEKDHQELFKKAYPKKGEILITNRGAGCSTPVIIDIDEEFSFQNAALIGFNQELVCNKYLFYFILKSRDEIMKTFVNGGLQPMLSNVVLGTIPISLPPLSEQHRIVQKLEELMQTCDELEASIKESVEQNEKLLQVVLREALQNN